MDDKNNGFDIDILKKLGVFTNNLRKEVLKIPKTGIDITQIIDYIENKIFEAGYLPAFPATVCINEVAAHYTVFDEGCILKKGDIVKIDFGVSQNGNITDCAFTIEIDDDRYKQLLVANLEGLNKAIDVAQIGIEMGKLGDEVDKIAQHNKYNTIHNLSGHQIGINDLHCGLHVPNYNNKDKSKIKDNMELAIEPFFTTGSPMIKAGINSNILHLKNSRSVRDVIAKKILQYIKENFSHLPFSKRWLLKEFDKRKVNYGIKILKSQGIIMEYETLVSVDDSIITQFEETILFYKEQKIVITRL